MAICSEDLEHACSQLLNLSFARNGSKELVAACSDDSGILLIALVPFQSCFEYMVLVLPSVVEDAPQIV